ncbi:hypothetical protein RSOLAG1IB_02511 [Rhizoctonia solani AG-1 IB]|uniref:Transmembrane protein n=1 Tax=Thanatephorus cucumeris (strain AG1-IB / isolate 7/3/14) TaxID=1108050 RepID=A0A0B7FNM8_THACB|nr:hypothetical protein RSOLAG1IB_02511 [Rhizoctonia solani AG-1 IB]
MLFGRTSLALVALFTATNVRPTYAQLQVNSNVTTCVSDYQWTINSLNQTSCLQSGYLSAQCNGGSWTVNGFPGGAPYKAPQGEGANICRCNTVVWNLLQACSLCQGGRTSSWGNWVANCSTNDINVGKYPLNLPPSVAIPSWAYLDFTSPGTFQADQARQAAAATTATESVSGRTQSPTSTSTSTSTPTPTSNDSNSNAGAIAGGVVGGVLGVVLLVVLGWFILRKKKSARVIPQHVKESYPGYGYAGRYEQGAGYAVQSYGAGQYAPVPTSQGDGHGTGTTTYEQSYAPSNYKPYDPSDPATFPPPAPLTSATPQPSVMGYGTSEHGHQQQARPDQHRYVPQV